MTDDTVTLNKIVAVEKGVKTRTDGEIAAVYHRAKQAPQFLGIARSYKPKDDDGDALPSENQVVAYKPQELIDMFVGAQVTFANVIATKDWGNTTAKADVVVGDTVLIKDVPVTYLLFLEKKLTDVKTFINNLPVLPAGENWTLDEQNGVWASEPAGTVRTRKIPDVQVLYPATDKHPAQVKAFDRDEVVGYWTTTKYSSALPATRVQELLDRVTTVLEAVKFAREQANMAEVTQMHVADDVLGYIFS